MLKYAVNVKVAMKYVTFIVIIIVVIVILICAKYKPSVPKATISYAELKPRIKTGDVIITHSASFIKGQLILKPYLGCDAAHVAMVYERDGEKRIIEVVPNWLDPFNPSDVKTDTLDHFVQHAERDTLVLVPTAKPIDFTAEDEEIYKNYSYDFLFMIRKAKTKKICSTFVAKIHEDKGLLTDHHNVMPCDYYRQVNAVFFSK